jgi:3-methyladenine DNA glycosylase/8-oxoguanine DNA glycosylase
MATIRTQLGPIGPYELRLVAHGATDPTRRRRRENVLELVFEVDGVPSYGRVSQKRRGPLEIELESDAPESATARLRYLLAVDDDHTPFLRAFARDPLIGEATRRFQGMRPLRRASVYHALLRALCGQLITAREAKALESRLIKRYCVPHGEFFLPPTQSTFAEVSVAALGRLGLVARKASTLVRLSRTVDLERLHDLSTSEAVAWLTRERGLGPWSAGVICLEGLGRTEHGLVGDLSLVKFCTARLGREATAADTARLLEPYGEWAGYAAHYLMASGVGGQSDLEVRRLRSERAKAGFRTLAAGEEPGKEPRPVSSRAP